jgi:hypothetical protein
LLYCESAASESFTSPIIGASLSSMFKALIRKIFVEQLKIQFQCCQRHAQLVVQFSGQPYPFLFISMKYFSRKGLNLFVTGLELNSAASRLVSNILK